MTQLTPVKSSNIYAIGYDTARQELTVQFKDKHGQPSVIWAYAGVPADLFLQMRTAESVGSFFATHIKGKFEARQLPKEPQPA